MLVSHELAQYVAAAYSSIVLRGNPDSIPTVSRCPECGADFDSRVDAMTDQDGAHLVLDLSGDVFAVLVGCEGYYVINPALLGLGEDPNWSDGSALGDEVIGVHDGGCNGDHHATDPCNR